MFTSGDLPDAVWGDVSVVNYREFLVPLEGYIEPYAPYITQLFKDYPGYRPALEMPPDNHIYGFPTQDASPWSFIAELPFINTTWLNNLGLAMPATTDALYDVLTAFKTRDPNGNGKADEVPLSFQQGWGTKIDALFSWFGTMENDQHIRVEADTVLFTPGEEKYYNALVYFNKLYNDGLLDKEGFSHTGEQYMAKVRLNPVVVGMHVSAFTHHIAGDNRAQYDVMPPVPGTVWNVDSPAASARPLALITTACRQPEVMVRYFDYMNSDFEIRITWNEGPRGVGYELNEEGMWYPILNTTAPEGMTGNEWRYTVGTGGRDAAIGDFAHRYLAPDDDAAIRMRNQAPYLAVGPKQYRPYGLSTAANEEVRSALATDINTYVQNFKATAIINGIDSAKWTEHLKTLEALKVPEYVAAWQEFYDMKK
jgi:putative aldouronate transport system substrate-binding protein